MALSRCPFCRGSLEAGAARCIWCGAELSREPLAVKPGDTLRIRNPFKGGHVEDVTVIRVERDGWGLEVKDRQGKVWGYIKPGEVIEVLQAGRSQ